jgi:hypothetical protein
MNDLTFNPVDAIISRQLALADETGRIVSPISIFIGKPYREDRCWECLYSIVGFEENYTFKVCGIDGFQAIEGAFAVIDGFLVGTDAFDRGRLCWDDGSTWEPSIDWNHPTSRNWNPMSRRWKKSADSYKEIQAPP